MLLCSLVRFVFSPSPENIMWLMFTFKTILRSDIWLQQKLTVIAAWPHLRHPESWIEIHCIV